MAIPAYMTIEGQNQGEISSGALSEDSVGTATQEGHEDEIMIQAFAHNVPRGTNEQSGQITSMVWSACWVSLEYNCSRLINN